jgi:hypothetical protein
LFSVGQKGSPQVGQAPVTAGTVGRRSRVAAPVVAAWSLIVLIILLWAVDVPLASATRWAGSGFGENLAAFIVLIPVVLVGFVVARRQPGNPLGWMFLGLVALLEVSGIGSDYAWLSYRLGHHLPLAAVGVALAPSWCPLLVTLPLMILLFPDGRLPSRRWRPVLWGYLAAGASWPVSVYAVTIGAVAAGDIHLVPGGDLRAWTTRRAVRRGWARSKVSFCWCWRCSGWCSWPARCCPGAAHRGSAVSSSSG